MALRVAKWMFVLFAIANVADAKSPIAFEKRAATVNRTEGYITASDGVQLFAATWTPDGIPIVATVTASHGLGEHILRYDPVFSKFASLGIKVHGIDHRGHGRTVLGPNKEKKGILGHTGAPQFADVLRDMHEATLRVKTKGVPHFVFGQSMGGLIALMYAQKFPDDVDGAVTNGAAVEPNSPAFSNIGAALLAFVIPTRPLPNGLNTKLLSHSTEEVEKYKNDPFVHGMITPITAKSLFSGGPDLLKTTETFKVPVLLTIGGEDQICRPSGVQKFHDKVTVKDKSITIFPGLFHECHNELPQRDIVIKTWSDWILSRATR